MITKASGPKGPTSEAQVEPRIIKLQGSVLQAWVAKFSAS